VPRPPCCRRIHGSPLVSYFKPRGIPLKELEETVLGLDELEALRLADMEGLYQDKAARMMKVSRPTFARIVESARRKVAEALVKGRALKLEGGNVMNAAIRNFQCSDCGHAWEVSFGTGCPEGCPACRSQNFHRAECDRGWARGDKLRHNDGSSCGQGRRRRGDGCGCHEKT